MKECSTELVQGFLHLVPYILTPIEAIHLSSCLMGAIKHKNFPGIVNDIGLLHGLSIHLMVVYNA